MREAASYTYVGWCRSLYVQSYTPSLRRDAGVSLLITARTGERPPRRPPRAGTTRQGRLSAKIGQTRNAASSHQSRRPAHLRTKDPLARARPGESEERKLALRGQRRVRR